MRKILITGANGLIGSELAAYFAEAGDAVSGIDNNMRADFFGPAADTRWNQARLTARYPGYRHCEADLRDRPGIETLVRGIKPDAIVHCAAQPSHDLAASRPYDDFDVNAVGTLNLLEAARRACPEAPFVFMSSNKVYGDAPNTIGLIENETRWDFADPQYADGIAEDFTVDQSKHSLFGASKLAADILVQEYGRYFGMPTCCLRGGCMTGPHHAGVELHGFLSYLMRCNVEGRIYRVFGYKGKQVRDNIHSYDVVRFIAGFIAAPRCAEVYNIGGGRANSLSILEAFARAEAISGKAMKAVYLDGPRSGDHVCYISNLSKMKQHYPAWDITRDLTRTLSEIHDAWVMRLAS